MGKDMFDVSGGEGVSPVSLGVRRRTDISRGQ